MCGIIGYTGSRKAGPILLDGLSNLEYRGYDSAGISIMDEEDQIKTCRAPGKLSNLKLIADQRNISGTSGIGHTRWATHGPPTDYNAHPHSDSHGNIVVAHNGIVENYISIKKDLIQTGHIFRSETDSEIIPHLIEELLAQCSSLEEAIREAAKRLKGANTAVIMSNSHPNKIFAFRIGNAGGIVVGQGDGEMLLASDITALLPHTRSVAYLSDSDFVTVDKDSAQYSNLNGESIDKKIEILSSDLLIATKGEYEHFMLKEINDQPKAVMGALKGRISFTNLGLTFDEIPLSTNEIKALDRVVLVGMGTSLHSAMVGRTWVERLSGISAEWDNSSEFRYRNPKFSRNTLVISISQSGETADTLSAMEISREEGAKQITFCNYEGTQASRIADGTIQIKAGLEVGVAASKTFTCTLVSLYLLAIYIGQIRGHLPNTAVDEIIAELSRLPQMLSHQLDNQDQYKTIASEYHNRDNFLFIGRGINYPMAMEGALKLKEISYIHAEGYPAGEMKHGPISLIDSNLPIIALIPKDPLYEKMLSSISEAKARGGSIISIASDSDTSIKEISSQVVRIPDASEFITPMLMATPLQLISYHIAIKRGCNIDQPRNLAKSVTVE